MPEAFAAKLTLTLKGLSMTRGGLASELGVDKSVIGKWATGAVTPSAHNLAQLSALIGKRVEGFSTLDWDREIDDLSEVLGLRIHLPPQTAKAPAVEPFRFMDDIRAATALRGPAYEGFFRSTRPFAAQRGRFIHDQSMIRIDPSGLLRLTMSTAGVRVDGWLAPLHNRLFCVGSELTSGSPVFGIVNGVGSIKADVMDGLILSAILDAGRTPTASAVIYHRIGDLTGDVEADDARFETMAAEDALAPEGSVPQDIQDHLLHDIGPTPWALGGDLLLQMPAGRSMAA
jgi:transcriptional regulator with XRE-family HTH domain